ncbi:hypothetical protein [Caldifermentibacillus hisashii]|uniref:hypothetical protein n=1 Tax=Caldifermentibacillus hisashii TaxID=996558 RepID=UPI0034D61D43
MGEVSATNFSVDNDLTVIKAEVNPDNKKQVILTFNQSLADKTTYKVTVNGVKSSTGVEMKESSTSEFTYEIGEVNKIELTKSKFVKGDKIADFVKLTNDKGIDVTSEYKVAISSTSGTVTDEDGTIGDVTNSEVAYVQVTVKNASGEIVKQSDALKVTLAPTAVTTLVKFGLGTNVDSVTEFNKAVKDGNLVSEMKLSDSPHLELLVKNNGAEQVVKANDITKIENLTPTVAVVSNEEGELKVKALSTGTAQVKLTIGDFVTTLSFTVKADSKIANATLDKSSLYFNTADDVSGFSAVNVKIADQYNKEIKATVDAESGKVSVGGKEVGTLSVKSSNTNVAKANLNDVTTESSSLPVTITEVGKGTATITVTFKDTKGNVVFTKTLNVTGKDAGAFAGYVIETDANAIDLDKDVAPEANDDAVNFIVYEVDANGNKIKAVDAASVTLNIQGYDKDPQIKKYINIKADSDSVAVVNENAFKTFAGSGTLNVDVLVNGTKIGTKSISYNNTDPVATKAVVNTVDIVVDNDKVSGENQPLNINELFIGHYDENNNKYTLSPKLFIQDQFGKTIDWDAGSPGTLVNTDALATEGIQFTITNQSNVVIENGHASLANGKTSGSFTVVVSDVDTTQVSDLLSAPVAFKVTIVD